ncbi:RNA polymerase sigma factor [Rufibacter tibetensis]|uniref:RNA polymerase sigma factor 70 region 4 type 2 domain-containing protein n=1 Tax=Rufibacter tibetensis TaxID=512763 RepID=A0A0P0C0L0_9BACT|nr:sigma-70 family RNA polymerase sigma factor [Rufibacter tibetensis]ALI98366.1 hypothetical protein DC20_04455 [Rufibacter tibetensis]
MQLAFQSPQHALQVTQLKNIHDDTIWKRFQLGDEEAFGILYGQYLQVIYNYGRKYSDDEALLEDCIHGLFLDLWENRANLSVPNSIRFYLYASIKRRIYKESLKRKEQSYENFSDIERITGEVNESIEDLMVRAQSKVQQKASLRQGLLLLTANQRKAILLKFYKNLPFQEIALVMNLSIDNVYKLVSRGLVVLKKNVKNLNVA